MMAAQRYVTIAAPWVRRPWAGFLSLRDQGKKSLMHVSLLCTLGFSLVAAGCGKSVPPPAEPASSKVAESAAPEAPTPPWQRSTQPGEFLCSDMPELTGSYGASLSAGRKAAAAKRWGYAVDGFRQALVERPEDPVALSELAWALLSAGDAPHALEAAERAIAKSEEPKLKAAAQYNAGRAAEALGDLARARSLLEASLALRANDTVKQRLEHLAAPTVRAAPTEALWKTCQGLPSVAAVCDCLVETPGGDPDQGTICEVEKSKGERGRVVSFATGIPDRESYAPGRSLVLVAKVGSKWSALQLLDQASSIDLDEQPRANEAATLSAYEELPYRGGTLHWVQTESKFSETAVGETVERGHLTLTLCWVHHDRGTPSCTRFALAEWDYAYQPAYDDGDGHCEVQTFAHYRLDAESGGDLHLVLEAGLDPQGRAGRYRLPFAGTEAR